VHSLCRVSRSRGEWCIGRIYENRGGPEDMRWFWALHAPSKPGTLRISNQVATLEAAKAEFEASWKLADGFGRDRAAHLVFDVLDSIPN
jgi:hypothetical protein